jgi:hypothetical protein
MKLMMSGKFKVTLADENSTREFDVLFDGPEDSPYQGVSNSINCFLSFLGNMENKSSIARFVPIQVSLNRV